MREAYIQGSADSTKQISGQRIKGAAIGAVIGAGIGFGENYLEQRKKIEKDVPLEESTIKGRINHEVIVFHRMDKKELVASTARGAAIGAFEGARESHSSEKRRERGNPQLLPLAA